MSKVVIQGNASGTGDFTIAAPNSDTNRTLTLPDEAGEVVVTDGTTLVVDNTNNRVGIGTSSPTQALDLESSTGSRVAFTDTGTRRWSIGNDATSLTFVDESGSSEKMRIDSSGVLYVNQLYNNTTAGGANVYVSGLGSLYRSTSSLRYKNTVTDATHGLTEIMLLRPVTYKGNNDGDKVFGGLIAEEVHDAGLTEFVTYNDEGQPDALAYSNMVSLCIKGIQEQQVIITAQQTTIEALEARVTALENA